MDSLASKNTTKAVRKALETMPTTLDATYDEAVRRIESQTDDDKELAFLVLSWVSYASRPLTIEELRQALAVEPEETELDDENMPDQDTILSICAGLVTSDQATGAVRLVHYTAQEYFERHRAGLFPNAQAGISLTCIAYLNLDTFALVCRDDDELRTRLDEMPLVRYASCYWGHHARESEDPEVQNAALDFLKQRSKLLSSVQALSVPDYLYSGYSQRYPKDVSGLWLAASYGLSSVVHCLIEQGYDADVCDSIHGWSALYKASENGHSDVVQQLLAHCSDPYMPDSNFGRSPLHQAASHGHTEVGGLLLDNGINIEILDKERRTPLHAAAANGQKDMVIMLTARGADLEARDKADWTPLQRAASHGHHAVTEALVNSGADVEAVMRGGWTALAKAANNGHTAIASLLIIHGANVKAHDKDGLTPLHLSIWYGHGPVATILMNNGAEIEAQDQNGWAPLHDAAWRGNLAMINLLLEKGALINAVSVEGWTPLHRATFGGQADAAELLLARGADPEVRDLYGETALLQASWNGHENLVKILLKANAAVGAKGNDGETALHRAAANGHLSVTASLLLHGAPINAKNKVGETAMDQAKEYHESEIVKMLDQWITTHHTTASSNGPSTPITPVTPNLGAGLAALRLEEEYEIVEKPQPEEQTSDAIDPAIFNVIPLDPTITTITTYGPPGFSKKARISTVRNGEKRRYFVKTYLKGNETSIFEGNSFLLRFRRNALLQSQSINGSRMNDLIPYAFRVGNFSKIRRCYGIASI